MFSIISNSSPFVSASSCFFLLALRLLVFLKLFKCCTSQIACAHMHILIVSWVKKGATHTKRKKNEKEKQDVASLKVFKAQRRGRHPHESLGTEEEEGKGSEKRRHRNQSKCDQPPRLHKSQGLFLSSLSLLCSSPFDLISLPFIAIRSPPLLTCLFFEFPPIFSF